MDRERYAETVDSCVTLPENAEHALRTHLGVTQGNPVRIAFVAGPGDVVGTFEYWKKGQFDPRVPVIAYSTQFYTLVSKLQATALIMHEHANAPPLRDKSFDFVTVARDRRGPGWRYHINSFRFSLKVLRHVWRYRPHLLLLGSDAPASLHVLLPTSTQLLLTAHNTYWPTDSRPTNLRERLGQRLTRLGLKRMRGAVCTSLECKVQMEALIGPTDDILVERPQILHAHAPALTLRSPNTPVRRLLYLGRIEAVKGIYDLLKVFEDLSPAYPDATLEFAGQGSDAETFKAAVQRSAAPVKYIGLLPADAVHAKLAQTDLLICPTRSEFKEGLALVVIEAAVHGVPSLVSSNVPAKELFPGAVVEYPMDDLVAMHEKLQGLLSQPAVAARLREGLVPACSAFFDRSKSWGTQLFQAMMR